MKLNEIKGQAVFYDVDTQNDFLNADGALYVQDAESLKPNLERLTQYALNKGIKILGSVDCHSKGDAELERNGGPFPDHCMKGTFGAKKIKETNQENISYIPNETLSSAELYKKIELAESVFFEKQHYDVFTNPCASLLLCQPKFVVLYGVATDFCIKAAALGMRERGVEVHVVEDAIKGVFPDKTKEALDEMKEAGVKFIKTQDVLDGLVENLYRMQR
ncbi:MAG: isochorismatase family cysteine hydrolase [Nanoarchaeota archaeon]|nr:isochorismatase family cysteine hydrolase [Nanoarchaeota archaeon]